MDHNDEASSFSSSSKRKRRSEAWKFFEEFPQDDNEDNRLRVKCKKCGLIMWADPTSGTSNLNRHHLKQLKDESQSQQGTLVDHKLYREKIAKAIVRHNYPFNFVEHEGIRDIHSFLNPCIKNLSRNTTKADVYKLYEVHNKIIKDELVGIPRRICLTSNL